MRSLLPLSVYCISLLSLQQLLALPAEERPATDRPDLLNKLVEQTEDITTTSEDHGDIASPASTPIPKRPFNIQHVPASGKRRTSPNLAWARPDEDVVIVRRMSRARRHAHTGSRGGHHYPHHAQLMRVGCVLGTCQVQNLSHRLYQLIGQSGREDSSPINPRSPHSYG